MERTVLVALSGGIDSAAAVMMLKDRKFEVEGLYIDMLGDVDARARAEVVADRLGVKLHVEDVADEFRAKIVEYTLSEHQAGRTPSPCVRCNPLIKWSVARRVADRLGIFWIATGHYVRIENGCLMKGVDPTKDQSYYLWALDREILGRAITPLGKFTKQEVREFVASHEGFEVLARGGESMSVCFAGRDYAGFLRENMVVAPGDVVDEEGVMLGQHDGFQLYTVGQKRGFTGGGRVVGVDPERNRVLVSLNEATLFSGVVEVTDWRLRDDIGFKTNRICMKIRGIGRNPESAVSDITIIDNERLRIELEAKDIWAVAKGQPVILYSEDYVVGGGFVV